VGFILPPYLLMMSCSSCGTTGGAVHHQVGVGQLLVDLADGVDGEHRAGGLAAELVGAVAGADGDGQRVHLGGGDERGGFDGIGQELVVAQLAHGPVAVFLLAFAVLEGAEAAQLTFDRHALLVGGFDDGAGDVDVVVVVGGGLAVFLEGAVHHDAGEAGVDGVLAGGGAVAVVEVHADRDLGIQLGGGDDQVAEVVALRVGAGAAGGLDDDGGVGFLGGHP
jgi:hypothetical protein